MCVTVHRYFSIHFSFFFPLSLCTQYKFYAQCIHCHPADIVFLFIAPIIARKYDPQSLSTLFLFV